MQQRVNGRLADQLPCQVEVERRQAYGLVVHHLGDVAALAEQHHRAETCVYRDADAKLVILIGPNVRAHGKARKYAAWLSFLVFA